MNNAKLVNASLFNFIIYANCKERAKAFHELVDSVVEKFPCRIIFVIGEEKDEFHVEKSFKQTGTIACDLIEIRAGGLHRAEIPFYILPHLEPDLPIYLLWGQDPTEKNEMLTQLLQYTDRLIFDAECTENLPAFADRVLKKMEKFPCEVLDMSWARSAGWREVFSKAIDSKEKLEVLRQAKQIKIEYAYRTQGVYLGAWIASRLGWKKTHSDGDTFFYEGHEVVLFPGPSVSFDVKTGGDEEIKMSRGANQVTVSISTKEECLLPFTVPFQTHSKGLTFIRELLYSPPSSQYIEMLKTIRTP